MKTFVAAVFFVAAMPAGAVTVTSIPGAPDPGALATETLLIDFDSGLPTGVTLTGNGSIVTGTNSSHASPAGDLTPYLSVPKNGSSGSAVLDWSAAFGTKIKSFSFYWGSVDGHNSVELRDAGGNTFYTLAGGAIPPANGHQSAGNTNRRVYFTLAPGETLGGLKFKSSGIAYEVDSLALNAAVPEPATWALMIGGFGLVGVAARRRRSIATVAA